jgi:endonuclease/exonuclease/phosphatase family metal-dependent hydrolase
MSVVMGDFNAEPHEESLQALKRFGFQDAWLHAGHSEPVPGSSDAWAVAQAHTFPSCNPIKRIDFVLVRPNNQEVHDRSHKSTEDPTITPKEVEVMACSVVGQAPADESYTPRDGLGMLDDDSPVWGSDHRAVVAELRLT